MAQVSVTTNPAVLVSNAVTSQGANTDYATVTFLVKDRSKTGVIYVEKTSAACTVANGLQWSFADGAFTVDLEPGEAIYARLASGGPLVLDVLSLGR